ncbi:MAG: protein kinase [Deltaproteobacteria bacterium]|nr:protein kinase [Deltaproteobacteria bacterium]
MRVVARGTTGAPRLDRMTGGITNRFTAGSRLGDYLIDGDLAGGWNVEAYEATHVMLPRRARLVVLAADFVDQTPAAVQMMREACLLEAMHHPGVPRVYACGVIAKRPWIACELIEGTALSEVINATRPLPVHEVLAMLRDVAEVLDHAHRRNIVHRNLRPEVLLRTRDRAFPVCITGWCDARIHDAEAELIDLRADVLALGAVVFTALTGARPTMAAVDRSPGAPRALTELIDRMLAAEPEARPSCAEIHDAAIRIAELSEVEMPVDDGELIEEVGVDLVDISRPTPVPAMRKPRWTPPLGAVKMPHAPLAAIKLDRKPNI